MIRVELIDADKGNHIITGALAFSLMTIEKTGEPIVWVITPDDMEDYFSKDEEIIKDFSNLAKEALEKGYVSLINYLFYEDPGYDEDDDVFGDDDDGWEI